MTDQQNDTGHDFAPTHDHELQDAHYHDEEAEIAVDDVGNGVKKTHPKKQNTPRRMPPPRKRYFEE